MMLASPLLPTVQPVFSAAHSDDSPLVQYRPARDREAFNSLLPPPIEFVEGSSSGTLAVSTDKYEPINASPKTSKPDRPETPKQPVSTPVKPNGVSTTTSNPKSTQSLHPGGIDATWPESCNIAAGLYNSGNTCFLNSALQCLLHTPPLLRMLIAHKKDACRLDKGFCMSCSLKLVAAAAHSRKTAFSPTPITSKLQVIAKHLRKGRQEDSHEFLRYAIDALQKACLAGYPPKLDPKVAETTWVHKIFGGQLRSRVTCKDCGHNSDTFDRILDLSVDIHRADALKEALKKFVAVDFLKGADKYKCEKCKKHVNAEKRFTVNEAPLILTVHLKRFSPLGRKIGHFVQYEEELSLQPFMSEGHYGPTYTLYGVICHAGGGPNSGHYYAFVKSRDNRWWEMNDESVSAISSPPQKKNAYMLFYQRKKGQGLEAAMNPGIPQPTAPRSSLVGSMKKRKEREVGDEDTGTKVSGPFIGPLPLSPAPGSESKRQKVNGVDPQAVAVKKKIQAAAAVESAKSTLQSLLPYASEGEDTDDDEKPEVQRSNGIASSPPVAQPPSSQPPSSPAIPAATFYFSSNSKKRKAHDESPNQHKRKQLGIRPRSSGYRGSNLNPYDSLGSGRGGKRFNRPRGI